MHGTEHTDGELLAKYASQRDEASFELVLRRHSGLVLSACRRVLGNTEDAEDAAQAVFLVLSRKAATLTGTRSVAPWLMRVARQAALNAAQARGVRRRHEQKAPTMQPAERSDAIPERQAFQSLLDEELDGLPEKYRRVLVLHHLAGHTEAETAKIVGSPEGTVCTWLARGRDRLRERLARRGIVLSVGVLALLLSAEAEAAVTSAPFVSATLGAVRLAAAGKSAAGAGHSPPAVRLSEGVLKSMFYAKLKTACIVIIAVAVAGYISGVKAYRACAAEDAPAAQAVPLGDQKAASKAEPFDAERAKRADLVARVIMDERPDPAAQPAPLIFGAMRVLQYFKKDGENAPEKLGVGWLKGPFPLKRECTIYAVKGPRGTWRLLDDSVESGTSHVAPAPAAGESVDGLKLILVMDKAEYVEGQHWSGRLDAVNVSGKDFSINSARALQIKLIDQDGHEPAIAFRVGWGIRNAEREKKYTQLVKAGSTVTLNQFAATLAPECTFNGSVPGMDEGWNVAPGTYTLQVTYQCTAERAKEYGLDSPWLGQVESNVLTIKVAAKAKDPKAP